MSVIYYNSPPNYHRPTTLTVDGVEIINEIESIVFSSSVTGEFIYELKFRDGRLAKFRITDFANAIDGCYLTAERI